MEIWQVKFSCIFLLIFLECEIVLSGSFFLKKLTRTWIRLSLVFYLALAQADLKPREVQFMALPKLEFERHRCVYRVSRYDSCSYVTEERAKFCDLSQKDAGKNSI